MSHLVLRACFTIIITILIKLCRATSDQLRISTFRHDAESWSDWKQDEWKEFLFHHSSRLVPVEIGFIALIGWTKPWRLPPTMKTQHPVSVNDNSLLRTTSHHIRSYQIKLHRDAVNRTSSCRGSSVPLELNCTATAPLRLFHFHRANHTVCRWTAWPDTFVTVWIRSELSSLYPAARPRLHLRTGTRSWSLVPPWTE